MGKKTAINVRLKGNKCGVPLCMEMSALSERMHCKQIWAFRVFKTNVLGVPKALK